MSTQVSKATQVSPGDQREKKRKETILDLSKYLEKSIRVKFAGGREAAGILKGFDPLLNLVLDNTTEYLRDPDDPYKLTEDTRLLGLVVCRENSPAYSIAEYNGQFDSSEFPVSKMIQWPYLV